METRHITNCGTQNDIPRDLTPNGPEPVWRQLRHWLSTVPQFCDFARIYRNKIKSKFKDAKEVEDVNDVLAEIEIACRFLSDLEFEVEYEPYEQEKSRSPDFCIRSRQYGDFNVETKRIREGIPVTLYHECMNKVILELRKVPSSLGVSLDCYSLNLPSNYAQRLSASLDSVISQCLEALRLAIGSLTSGDSTNITIKGFEEIQFRITHVPGKSPATPTANFSAVSPILYTQ